MAILRIPGNSRGNFWVVKFPGIPGGLDLQQQAACGLKMELSITTSSSLVTGS